MMILSFVHYHYIMINNPIVNFLLENMIRKLLSIDNTHWNTHTTDSQSVLRLDKTAENSYTGAISMYYNWSTFYNRRDCVSARCELHFQGRVVNERTIRICLSSSETTRRHVAGHRFSRARPRALGEVTQGERERWWTSRLDTKPGWFLPSCSANHAPR